MPRRAFTLTAVVLVVGACSTEQQRGAQSNGGGTNEGSPTNGGTTTPKAPRLDAGVDAAASDAGPSDAGPDGRGGRKEIRGEDAGPTGLPVVPLFDKEGGIEGQGFIETVLCNRIDAAFDLSKLTPSSAMPAAFINAWRNESTRSRAPGLVLLLRDVAIGPVRANFGGVHARNPSIWELSGPPISAGPVDVRVTTGSAIELTTTTTPFMTSFGDTTGRHGFVVRAFSVQGSVDDACEKLTARATLEVPGTMTAQVFDGSTLGELLGAPNVTITGTNEPGWRIELSGTVEAINAAAGAGQ